jgi:GxxExxY protein
MTENEIARMVVDLTIKVHKVLGPGLLESAYEACLVHELKKPGAVIQKQVVLPV